MNTLNEIIAIVQSHSEMLFDEPIVIHTHHAHVFTCYGLAAQDGLWLLDGAGEWHGPLSEEQGNGKLVINSIYQRVKAMELEAA